MNKVEDIYLKIKKANEDLEILEKEKQDFVDSVSSKIDSVKNELNELNDQVLTYMEENNVEEVKIKDGFFFRTKKKTPWIIKNEQEFLEILKKKFSDEKIEQYIIKKEILDKNNVNALLSKLEDSGKKVPDCVEKTKDGFTIKFKKQKGE